MKEISERNLPEDVRYADGWMIETRPDDSSEAGTLMDRAAHLKMLKKQ